MGGLNEKLARASELHALCIEASNAGNVNVADACTRLRSCVLIGAPLHAEDCFYVQGFIGARTAQNRYGR